MKDLFIGILCAVILFASLFFLVFGIVEMEQAMDADLWNNGFCSCGGEWEFCNATHKRNGGNYYYYKCDACGDVIETNHPQKNESKSYEVAAIVDEYNAENNCFVLVDWNGEAWFFEGELEVGQLVIVVFDDCGTADIYDDEIIEIRG